MYRPVKDGVAGVGRGARAELGDDDARGGAVALERARAQEAALVRAAAARYAEPAGDRLVEEEVTRVPSNTSIRIFRIVVYQQNQQYLKINASDMSLLLTLSR